MLKEIGLVSVFNLAPVWITYIYIRTVSETVKEKMASNSFGLSEFPEGSLGVLIINQVIRKVKLWYRFRYVEISSYC